MDEAAAPSFVAAALADRSRGNNEKYQRLVRQFMSFHLHPPKPDESELAAAAAAAAPAEQHGFGFNSPLAARRGPGQPAASLASVMAAAYPLGKSGSGGPASFASIQQANPMRRPASTSDMFMSGHGKAGPGSRDDRYQPLGVGMGVRQGMGMGMGMARGIGMMENDEALGAGRSEQSQVHLQHLLSVLSQVATMLNKSNYVLVDAVLAVDWAVHSDAIAEAFISFAENLVSAHAFYVVPCLKVLIEQLKFRPPSALPRNVTLDTVFARTHRAISSVLALIPTAASSAMNLLIEAFPHKREKEYEKHAAYLQNILIISSYAPSLAAGILSCAIDRVIQIDVEIQVEVEDLEEGSVNEVSNMIFDVDMEGGGGADDEILSDDESQSQDSPSDRQTRLRQMMLKLDAMLTLLFEHLDNVSHGDRDVANMYFRNLLGIFERIILPTHRSRHTQFLLFRAAALAPEFQDAFLGFVAQRALDISGATTIRIAAAGYLGSFLARAKFIETTTVKDALEVMTRWTHTYLDQYEGSAKGVDVGAHASFYAIVQSLFYVICFRWKKFMDDDSTWLRGLGLQRLVESRLNPLKDHISPWKLQKLHQVCLPNVCKEFARVTHRHELAYCYAVMERNRRLMLPSRTNLFRGSSALSLDSFASTSDLSASSRAALTPSEMLDTFFPFEPYRLANSAKYVDALYIEWSEDGDFSDADEEAMLKSDVGGSRGNLSSNHVRSLSSSQALPASQAQGSSRGFASTTLAAASSSSSNPSSSASASASPSASTPSSASVSLSTSGMVPASANMAAASGQASARRPSGMSGIGHHFSEAALVMPSQVNPSASRANQQTSQPTSHHQPSSGRPHYPRSHSSPQLNPTNSPGWDQNWNTYVAGGLGSGHVTAAAGAAAAGAHGGAGATPTMSIGIGTARAMGSMRPGRSPLSPTLASGSLSMEDDAVMGFASSFGAKSGLSVSPLIMSPDSHGSTGLLMQMALNRGLINNGGNNNNSSSSNGNVGGNVGNSHQSRMYPMAPGTMMQMPTPF